MQLISATTTILHQLRDVIQQLTETEFKRPSTTLGHSTIGQHTRHTLEFFICLEQGFEKGVVNYDRRPHDKLIEEDKFIALSAIQRTVDFVISHTADQCLKLEVGYERHKDDSITLETNFYRELAYNIEHAVHHMAIMKIGIKEVAPHVSVPVGFGIAVSTLRHQESLATSRL